MKTAYQSFAYTTQGRTHEKEGVACQDYSAHYGGGGLLIVAVADGHGEANSFRSDRGAKFAVGCTIDAIREFADKCPEPPPPNGVLDAEEALEGMVGELVRRVVFLWQDRVEQDYKGDPFTADELARCDARHRARLESEEPFKAYGSTLIAAAVTENYWFGFHIGDGRFTVLQADGKFAQPVPWDERCYLHLTTSICDYGANDRPRVHCEIISGESPPPIALFLCSDGIDDNYPVENNEEHLYDLYQQITNAFAADGFESTSEQIKPLCDSFAKNAKGDDTSLAILIDMGRVRDGAQALELRGPAQENAEGREEAVQPGTSLPARDGAAQERQERQDSAANGDLPLPPKTGGADDGYSPLKIRSMRTALVMLTVIAALVTAFLVFHPGSDAPPVAAAKTQDSDRSGGAAGPEGNSKEAMTDEAIQTDSPSPNATDAGALKPGGEPDIGVRPGFSI